MKRIIVMFMLTLVVLLPACAGLGSNVIETPSLAPTDLATEVATDVPQPQLSFEPATFRDETAGFEFDYPSTWTQGEPMVLGDRAYQVQFTAPDGNSLTATIYRWDPKNDVVAYADHRKPAWEGSGLTILSEEPLTLAGDHQAISFVIQLVEGGQMFVLFTDVGEYYLDLSGSGDLTLLKEIAMTVELIDPGQ